MSLSRSNRHELRQVRLAYLLTDGGLVLTEPQTLHKWRWPTLEAFGACFCKYILLTHPVMFHDMCSTETKFYQCNAPVHLIRTCTSSCLASQSPAELWYICTVAARRVQLHVQSLNPGPGHNANALHDEKYMHDFIVHPVECMRDILFCYFAAHGRPGTSWHRPAM
jgi:hypothetical protein